MNTTAPESADSTTQADERLSSLYSVFVVSLMMFDGRAADDVIALARTSMRSLSSCRTVAAYLVSDGQRTRLPGPADNEAGRVDHADHGTALDGQVDALSGEDGRVDVPASPWAMAFALRDFTGPRGYLVVAADTEPSTNEMFLLRVLVQQTAAALATSSCRQAEQEYDARLRSLDRERDALHDRLAAVVAELRRERNIHDVLAGTAAAGAGEAGIARSLHQLTGLAVTVHDQFGNLRTWAGPRPPDAYVRPGSRRWEQLLSRASRRDGPLRDRDRLVVVIQAKQDVLAVLALVDPERTADHDDVLALRQAATMLSIELSHQRNLAEVELRLRRELLADLVSGADVAGAFARAAALGHDLHGAHHVAVVQWRHASGTDVLLRSIWHASISMDLRVLAAPHGDSVVLVMSGLPAMQDLHEAVSAELGTSSGTIGVGGRSLTPAELPRSFHEAQRALAVRRRSPSPYGVTSFQQLGLYRLLGADDSDGEVALFIREWLGPLLDYDDRHHGDLVRTLSEYLERGGSYDETAKSLLIHRSTLRYRLKRIRVITGKDLADVDTRLNLHVATRALSVLKDAP
jgi:sugar diacid utilization regulator